eukprot:SAG31_NODE_911_length_11071_cov_16.862195_7_plen_907_part_00
MILGGIFFGLLMFQPVADASAAAATRSVQPTTTNQSVDNNEAARFSDPRQLKELFGALQTQLHQLTKKQEALQNKTDSIETENAVLKKRVVSLESIVIQLSNKTTTESQRLKVDVENIAVRLDQCKEETLSFVEEMERRRMQGMDICQGSGLSELFAACCPNHGGHRRSLQDHGCDALPETCPGTCAPLFIDFFEGCSETINSFTPAEQQEFAGFYADCTEMAQQQAAISDGAKPALMFHMVVIDQEAEQQAAMSTPGSGLGPLPPLGPVVLPPASSPTPSPHSDNAAVQEFQRVCSRANLTVCAPQCNPVTEGYLLSVLIQGRGTLMTCNQEEGVYSWQGQSALGSCITKRGPTWLENIMTHAAGTFALELSATISVVVAADLVAGQSALLHGVAEGLSPVWTFLGEGPAFVVGAGAELEISAITVAATSGLAFRIADSSTVVLSTLQLQKGDGSADAISCAALATGVGQAGLTCANTGFGGVNVAGPLFISTSGVGFGMGATKYMGSDRSIFEEAVSTREPGLYTCQISHDEMVTLTLPVESAMHVAIVGDDSMPQWSFTGGGLAFTVAVHAYLNLAYVTVPRGQVSLMQGGELSLDHVLMQGAQIHVAGGVASISRSELQSDGLTVPLLIGSGGAATVTEASFRSTAGNITAVSVSEGGSLTVGGSQLIQVDGSADPLPCDGTLPRCVGEHEGSVTVEGPSVINMAAPLVCDVGTRVCLSDPCAARFGVACANGGRCDYGTATCVCPGSACDWVGDTCERQATEADILLKIKVGDGCSLRHIRLGPIGTREGEMLAQRRTIVYTRSGTVGGQRRTVVYSTRIRFSGGWAAEMAHSRAHGSGSTAGSGRGRRTVVYTRTVAQQGRRRGVHSCVRGAQRAGIIRDWDLGDWGGSRCGAYRVALLG